MTVHAAGGLDDDDDELAGPVFATLLVSRWTVGEEWHWETGEIDRQGNSKSGLRSAQSPPPEDALRR